MPSRSSSPTDRNPPTNKALTPPFAHSPLLPFDTGSYSFEPMPWGTPQSSPCDEVGGYFGLDPDHSFERLWTPFDTDFLFESGLEGTPPRLPDVKVVGYSGVGPGHRFTKCPLIVTITTRCLPSQVTLF